MISSEKMVESGAFSWINRGVAMTSTTHIHNLVHGIKLAIEQGKAGEVYFITDGEDLSIKDFLTQLLRTQKITLSKKSISSKIVR